MFNCCEFSNRFSLHLPKKLHPWHQGKTFMTDLDRSYTCWATSTFLSSHVGPIGCTGDPGLTKVWHWVVTPLTWRTCRQQDGCWDNMQGERLMISAMSHTGSVDLTGLAVETTCTVDMKQQQRYCSKWDGSGKAPVVSFSPTRSNQIRGEGTIILAKLIFLEQWPFLIAFKRKKNWLLCNFLDENIQLCIHTLQYMAGAWQ